MPPCYRSEPGDSLTAAHRSLNLNRDSYRERFISRAIPIASNENSAVVSRFFSVASDEAILSRIDIALCSVLNFIFSHSICLIRRNYVRP